MLENPQLWWSFIRKVHSIVSIQLLLTVAVAAVVVTVHPIKHFFASTGAGLAVYIVLIITPFIEASLQLLPARHFHSCYFLCRGIDLCIHQRNLGLNCGILQENQFKQIVLKLFISFELSLT